MSDGWPRVCSACGARHLFFAFPYRGRRVHSAVHEDIKLGCRRCYEPLMEWVDKDGDTYSLVLDDDPSVEGLRDKARRWEDGPTLAEAGKDDGPTLAEVGRSALSGVADFVRLGSQATTIALTRALRDPRLDAPPPSTGPVAPRARNARDPNRRRGRG